eukprot:6987398-Prymnesium_polylepis.1
MREQQAAATRATRSKLSESSLGPKIFFRQVCNSTTVYTCRHMDNQERKKTRPDATPDDSTRRRAEGGKSVIPFPPERTPI